MNEDKCLLSRYSIYKLVCSELIDSPILLAKDNDNIY